MRLSAGGVATRCGNAAAAAADAPASSVGERPHAIEESLALHRAPLFDSAAELRAVQQKRNGLVTRADLAGRGRASARQRSALAGTDRTGNCGTRATLGTRSLAGRESADGDEHS